MMEQWNSGIMGSGMVQCWINGPATSGIDDKIKLRSAATSLFNVDGFVKSLKTSFDVIPAKAGIQCFQIVLDACLRGHDGISDFLGVCQIWAEEVFRNRI